MNFSRFHTRIFEAAALLFGCQREWWGVSTLRQVRSLPLLNPSFIIGQREGQTEKQTTSEAITLPAEKREERKRRVGGEEAEYRASGRKGVVEHQGCTISQTNLNRLNLTC